MTDLINMGLGAALARIGIGMFALDSMGRNVSSNAASQALLGDGLSVVQERLVLANPSASGEAIAAIRNALDGNPETLGRETKPVLVYREPPKRPLVLYVLPIPISEQSNDRFLTRARAIVLLMNPAAAGLADPSLVRDVLGVTLGEARIASLDRIGIVAEGSGGKTGNCRGNRAVGAEAGLLQGRGVSPKRAGSSDRKVVRLKRRSGRGCLLT